MGTMPPYLACMACARASVALATGVAAVTPASGVRAGVGASPLAPGVEVACAPPQAMINAKANNDGTKAFDLGLLNRLCTMA